MMRAPRAASAVAVLGNLYAEGVRAKMRNLAKKVDGFLGIAGFEFGGGGAHTAKRSDPAIGANGFAGVIAFANILDAAFPTLLKGTGAEVVAIAVRKDANGHLAFRIDSTAVVATAAGVALFGRRKILGEFGFDEAKIGIAADRIAKFQGHRLLGGQPHRKWTLGTIGARIHQGIKLEFDAEVLLREALHFVDFMKVQGSGNRFEFEREFALEKERDATHAAVERTGNLSKSFIGFPSRTV